MNFLNLFTIGAPPYICAGGNLRYILKISRGHHPLTSYLFILFLFLLLLFLSSSSFTFSSSLPSSAYFLSLPPATTFSRYFIFLFPRVTTSSTYLRPWIPLVTTSSTFL
jgi:hypothetical protein